MCVRCLPAVDEVGHRVVLAEAGGVQISTDLHIITRQQLHGRHALLLEHTALQRRTQQQHEVICREREEEEIGTWGESVRAEFGSFNTNSVLLTEEEQGVGFGVEVGEVEPLDDVWVHAGRRPSPWIVWTKETLVKFRNIVKSLLQDNQEWICCYLKGIVHPKF